MSIAGAQIIQAGFEIRIVPPASKARVLKPPTVRSSERTTKQAAQKTTCYTTTVLKFSATRSAHLVHVS